jgi:hypothetical protein
MLNGQVNVTELSRGTQAPLLLLKLMGDLAALDQELQTAEDRTGQPVSTYQDAFAERLCRVGVSDQKIDDFSRWQQTISSLIADNSGDEDHLAKIIAAETACGGIRRPHRRLERWRTSFAVEGYRGLN